MADEYYIKEGNVSTLIGTCSGPDEAIQKLNDSFATDWFGMSLLGNNDIVLIKNPFTVKEEWKIKITGSTRKRIAYLA